MLLFIYKNKNPVSLNVLEEQAVINKKTEESGKVLIQKKVHETEEAVSVPVAINQFDIKKFFINKYFDAAPSVRQEGDTTIIPVIKEVLVVEKKLLLVEEVHVTKHVVEKTEEHLVPLRKEEIEVKHYTRNS